MKVYERICLHDWHVDALNGDRQDCKRGKAYTTSAPHEDGTVTVFSSFWVRAPGSIFEPFEPALQVVGGTAKPEGKQT